ncbi:progranulin isoform X1 [Dermochelys coriacea]|uniref:progranulin isoform X1 n=2 Tax=Dermochelys coriacea TaxID=27794 RepID=UPI0018E7EA1D|nr:progranulin isoform X1 [Dermochelys coriacea]
MQLLEPGGGRAHISMPTGRGRVRRLLPPPIEGLSPRMWSLVPLWLALSGAAASLRCPDGQLCQGLDVCCQDPGGDGYACCPPSLGSPHSMPMTQASSVAKPAGTVCPDGTRCPMEYSCLRTSAGSFSCCPLSEAVACADRHHCCPRGSHCSADGKSCFVFPGLPAADAVQCPDGESECPNESTCCMMPTGSWGCCPMPQAACCTDKVHCCPHATTCDLEHARCLSATGEQPMGSKVPARKRAPWQGVPASFGMITCPDQSACPDSTTCCQLPTRQYGCCPLQNAVCCSDHLHCCPQGTTCDLRHSKCALTLGQTQPLTRLQDASKTARDVRCDEQTSCPDSSTCCRLVTGAWGCCPFPEAVCCQDHVHCCPKGYTCDPAGGSCHPPATPVPWLEKTPARVRAPSTGRDVQCDEQTSCPEGNTCCRLDTGSWGCCPLEEAVCCQDHVHCCPKGYTCDPAGGSCQPPATPVPWLEKTPARVRAPSTGRDVQCDEQTSCPEGNTCCRLDTGSWGCCPLPEAVCCEDHLHCCPKGHACDPAGGSCQQALLSVPWAPKAPSHVPGAAQSRGVKCNQTVSCEDGQTCCKSETGPWACCHLPNAVCCEDHQHCCPGGYTCNLATQSCEKQQAGRVLPGDLSLVASLRPASPEPSNKVTCDAQHYCSAHQTCCKAASGTWACCPYLRGSCCPDHRHCCPWGYRCSSSSLDCKRHWLPRWDAGAPWLL